MALSFVVSKIVQQKRMTSQLHTVLDEDRTLRCQRRRTSQHPQVISSPKRLETNAFFTNKAAGQEACHVYG